MAFTGGSLKYVEKALATIPDDLFHLQHLLKGGKRREYVKLSSDFHTFKPKQDHTQTIKQKHACRKRPVCLEWTSYNDKPMRSVLFYFISDSVSLSNSG